MSGDSAGQAAASAAPAYDITKILAALPHRYPLLLVDRVKSMEIGEGAHAEEAASLHEKLLRDPGDRDAGTVRLGQAGLFHVDR